MGASDCTPSQPGTLGPPNSSLRPGKIRGCERGASDGSLRPEQGRGAGAARAHPRPRTGERRGARRPPSNRRPAIKNKTSARRHSDHDNSGRARVAKTSARARSRVGELGAPPASEHPGPPGVGQGPPNPAEPTLPRPRKKLAEALLPRSGKGDRGTDLTRRSPAGMRTTPAGTPPGPWSLSAPPSFRPPGKGQWEEVGAGCSAQERPLHQARARPLGARPRPARGAIPLVRRGHVLLSAWESSFTSSRY